MREEFKRLKKWVEMCPVGVAMRIEDLESKNESLKKQLDAKIVLINNGWEEERYVLQSKIEKYEKYFQENSVESMEEKLEPYYEELEKFWNEDNKNCIICNQLIEDEEYHTDISLGTYWCMPCGNEEIEKEKGVI
jgi:hypothetical protein